MNNKGISILNLVLNIVLIASVIYLFTTKSSDDTTVKSANNALVVNTETGTSHTVDTSAMLGQLNIVYVNTDSLWNQYDFVNNALRALERDQTRLQGSYEAKMTKLQKDYNDYMEKGKANLLTLKQQQDYEASLEKQQNDIKLLEDEVTNKLIVKKQELNNQINDTIQAFLNRYRISHGYDLIFQHSYLNGILSGTPSIDITEDVVSKLNAEYNKFKK